MLANALKGFFDSGSRLRGADYFRMGVVRIESSNDTSLKASVDGTHIYDVNISIRSMTLTGSCTCLRFEDVGACKHIWATLLAADARGLMRNHGKPVKRYVDEVVDTDEDDYFDDGSFEEEIIPERKASVSTLSRKRKAKVKKNTETEWIKVLDSIQKEINQSATHLSDRNIWPLERQIVYLLSTRPAYYQYGYQRSGTNGDLTLEIHYRELKKDGDWSKLRPGYSYFSQEMIDPVDQAIKQTLPEQKNEYSYYGYSQNSIVVSIKPFRQRSIVEQLCRSGRCFIKVENQRSKQDWTYEPLSWDDGPAWQWRLDITTKPGGKQFLIQPTLRQGNEQADLKSVRFFTQGGLVFFQDRVARCEFGNAYTWVQKFQKHESLMVPTSNADELLAMLHSFSEIPPIAFPPELRFDRVEMEPIPMVTLKLRQSFWGDVYDIEWAMKYDHVQLDVSRKNLAIYQPEERRLIIRNMAKERVYLSRLIKLAGAKTYDRDMVLSVNPKKVPELINQLTGEGWLVELQGKKIRTATGDFQFNVSSGIDWFELHGTIPFGDTIATLPQLLTALRKSEEYVVLQDGSLGRIPEAMLKEFGLLTRLGEEKDGHLRFKRNQVGLLDALLASRPAAHCDDAFTRIRKELKEFDGIKPCNPPESFQGELRPYQSTGLGWFDFLRRFNFGGCLADDMGLGKTVQVLALLEQRRKLGIKKPSLVVMPRSLIFNWKQEAARFAPELRILDHSERIRIKECDHFEDYDLILTTYAILRMDILLFEKYEFDYVILDEAHAVKNDKSESAKAARLLHADYRLALSGTPVENHLGELWSLFEFLNPGMLGVASVFKMIGNRQGDIDEQRLPLLAQALRPFILRRTKEQVAPDLPEKLEQTIYCEMEPAHRKLYNELRDSYRNELLGRVAKFGMARSKMYVLEALLRLRQAACHPGLLDNKLSSSLGAKLESLFNHLEEVLSEGRKVLVFSQFTSFLKLLRSHLDNKGISYEYLDGSIRKRQPIVERFQNDINCQLFLISLKAGGLGLNLTAAEYVFLLDPWWNPAVEAQAIDRAHRIGQTKNIFAYRLIVKDTVEEKVLELQQKKRQLADAIISADQGMLKTLQKEDLELLLS